MAVWGVLVGWVGGGEAAAGGWAGAGWGAGPGRGWEGGREEARVVVYGRADFRGPALEFFPGEEVPDLADLRFPDGSRVNDRVMSVRVVGRASVLVYEHRRFRGEVLRATGDVRDFARRFLPESAGHWGNRISALRVEWEGGAGRPGNDGPGNRARGVSAREAEKVVRGAYRAVLDREVDPVGLRSYTERMLEQGWTAAMVEEALRASDEFRFARVDGFIRAAYAEVLRREVDPTGLAHYRRLMVDRGWDAARVKRDLRNSAEYRRGVVPLARNNAAARNDE